MKTSYNREIRHIVANYSIKRTSTGYRLGSRSDTVFTLHSLLRHQLIECDDVEGLYVFFKPTSKLISLVGADLNTPPHSAKEISEGYSHSVRIS